MKSTIYVIRNTETPKVYIGQTRLTLEERFKRHLSDAKVPEKSRRPLYRAMKKYGKDKFYIEAIEECNSEDANEREKFWIAEFLSNKAKGYNATIGGKAYEPYDYEEIKKYLEHGYSTRKICGEIGCCKQTVFQVARINSMTIPNSTHNRKVMQMDDNGNTLNEFDSLNTAAIYIKETINPGATKETVRKNISRCCNHPERTMAYGYVWCHVDDKST